MNGQPIVNFFRVVSLVLVLLVVALLAAIVTMRFAIHGAEVQVPAFKSMTVAEARSQAAGLGLTLDVDNRYYSADVAAGHILSQSPAPGTVVRREWQVRISESLGPQKVDVPNMVGLDARAAELQLRRAGLEVGAVDSLPGTTATMGTVLAQDPPAHTQGIAQPSVNLLIAAPSDDPPNGYVMPDMTGWLASSAVATLAKVGIKTAPIHWVEIGVAPISTGSQTPIPPVKPGAILTQSPQAGAHIDQSTRVTLTAAR